MPYTAKYGNYKGYQGSERCSGHHLNAHIPDGRLTRLIATYPDLLCDKKVLDVGCNDGRVSVDCVVHFTAKEVLAIDIDEGLITAAKSHLSFVYSRLPPPDAEADAEDKSFFPISSVQTHHHIPYPVATYPPTFPRSVSFTCANILSAPLPAESFDTILLLSVIKWLHIHGGDDGLVKVLRKLVSALVHGGRMVVEAQHWGSYKKAVKKVPGLKGLVQKLEMRPDGFVAVLEGMGVNFLGKIEGEGVGSGDGDGEGADVKVETKANVEGGGMEVDPSEDKNKKRKAKSPREIWIFEKP